MKSQPTSLIFYLFFDSTKRPHNKVCKLDHNESDSSLELSFRYIWGLSSDFHACKSFLESNFPGTLTLWDPKLKGSIDFSNFFVRSYLPLIKKNLLLLWMVFWCMRTSLENSMIFAYVFDCLTSFSSNYHCSLLYLVFDATSSKIDGNLWNNPLPNVFVFGDFNITSIMTGLNILVELIDLVNLLSSNFSLMVNLPTQILTVPFSHRLIFFFWP